ncbi:hypothetical protein SHIRM173S_02789 [Streptomyces hirsutus]
MARHHFTDAPREAGALRPKPQVGRPYPTDGPGVGSDRRPSRPAQPRKLASFALSWSTDLVWIWLTLLSVTPSTWPISARVSPS